MSGERGAPVVQWGVEVWPEGGPYNRVDACTSRAGAEKLLRTVYGSATRLVCRELGQPWSPRAAGFPERCRLCGVALTAWDDEFGYAYDERNTATCGETDTAHNPVGAANEVPEVFESCCPMPINISGDGPELDPARVRAVRCMQHGWESWPCRYEGSRWSVRARAGHHDDGRTWQSWTVYLDGVAVFTSPSIQQAEDGMQDWCRTGHGPERGMDRVHAGRHGQRGRTNVASPTCDGCGGRIVWTGTEFVHSPPAQCDEFEQTTADADSASPGGTS